MQKTVITIIDTHLNESFNRFLVGGRVRARLNRAYTTKTGERRPLDTAARPHPLDIFPRTGVVYSRKIQYIHKREVGGRVDTRGTRATRSYTEPFGGGGGTGRFGVVGGGPRPFRSSRNDIKVFREPRARDALSASDPLPAAEPPSTTVPRAVVGPLAFPLPVFRHTRRPPRAFGFTFQCRGVSRVWRTDQ